jgi:hypothetical protein
MFPSHLQGISRNLVPGMGGMGGMMQPSMMGGMGGMMQPGVMGGMGGGMMNGTR